MQNVTRTPASSQYFSSLTSGFSNEPTNSIDPVLNQLNLLAHALTDEDYESCDTHLDILVEYAQKNPDSAEQILTKFDELRGTNDYALALFGQPINELENLFPEAKKMARTELNELEGALITCNEEKSQYYFSDHINKLREMATQHDLADYILSNLQRLITISSDAKLMLSGLISELENMPALLAIPQIPSDFPVYGTLRRNNPAPTLKSCLNALAQAMQQRHSLNISTAIKTLDSLFDRKDPANNPGFVRQVFVGCSEHLNKPSIFGKNNEFCIFLTQISLWLLKSTLRAGEQAASEYSGEYINALMTIAEQPRYASYILEVFIDLQNDHPHLDHLFIKSVQLLLDRPAYEPPQDTDDAYYTERLGFSSPAEIDELANTEEIRILNVVTTLFKNAKTAVAAEKIDIATKSYAELRILFHQAQNHGYIDVAEHIFHNLELHRRSYTDANDNYGLQALHEGFKADFTSDKA